MGTDAIFMDDNARLESETIPQMAWPRSQDLNPIEHVWDMLGKRIAGRSAPSTSSNKPYYRNGHYCRNKRSTRIASMPLRCQACISARGYHTRYLACGFHCTFCLQFGLSRRDGRNICVFVWLCFIV
ncbi:hypothetical protein AVEN_250495-1 [Araneus ventricosus]|uniref:Tc1-like transposase DDE domain-containing protein n=1 Tax=Araneus ventricosus TaxID=182803 RepID=A0A4Y2FFM1_ARAVE|nr:hypothetical protein AVEN_250495-1 [Araneus ventricosus]